jgi:hypothetical protein
MMMNNLKRTSVYGAGGIIVAGIYELVRSRGSTGGDGANKRTSLKYVKNVPYVTSHQSLTCLLHEIEEIVWATDKVSWMRLVNSLENLIEMRNHVEDYPEKTSLRDRVRGFTYCQRFTESMNRIMTKLEKSTRSDPRDVIRIQKISKEISNHCQNNLSVVVFFTRDVLLSPPMNP